GPFAEGARALTLTRAKRPHIQAVTVLGPTRAESALETHIASLTCAGRLTLTITERKVSGLRQLLRRAGPGTGFLNGRLHGDRVCCAQASAALFVSLFDVSNRS